MVPKGWKYESFAQAKVLVIDGDRGTEYPKTTDFQKSGYCVFLSAKNVTKSGFKFDEIQFISEEKHQKLRKGIVKRSNIVLTTRGSVGNFAYFDDSVPYEVIRLNSGMVVLDSEKSNVHPDYLYAVCKSSVIDKQIERAAFGSAQPQLTVGIINNLKIPVPPLPEQRKIAQILSTWDKAITTTERLLSNRQQQKKALMQRLLTGKQRFAGFEGEWKKEKLASLTRIFDGTHTTPKYEDKGIPFYSVEHLTNDDFQNTKFISETVYEAECKRVFIEKDDILMTRIGDIGTSKYINWDVKASFYVSLALIKHAPSFDSAYLSHFISCSFFQKELWNRTIHVAFPKKINLGEIGNCEVLIPSLDEQQKIASVLSAADAEITTIQNQLDNLKLQKKALMQQLLTGKRRVKVDSPALATQ